MIQYIDKSALVAEIKRRISLFKKEKKTEKWSAEASQMNVVSLGARIAMLEEILSYLDTLEVKDPYELCVQYPSVKDAIQAHAETYSFNIESELFNQLSKEQQELWRKEIEQACISGGDAGYSLAKDKRYKENLEVKEEILDKEGKTKLMKKCVHKAYQRGYDMGVLQTTNKINHNTKEVDLEKEFDNYAKDILACDVQFEPFTHLYNCAKYFYKLGLTQKGE